MTGPSLLEHATRAAAYAALATVLLLAATATKPSGPLDLHWRTATQQEEQEYERQRLADALDQLREQR